jgi:hypothetical protein
MKFLKHLSITLLGPGMLAACGEVKHDYTDGIRYIAFDTSPASDSIYIELKSDVTDVYERDYDNGYTVTLMNGWYKAKLESSEGVFYQGSLQNIETKHEKGSVLLYTGGFFIPDEVSKPVWWWYESSSLKGRGRTGASVGFVLPTGTAQMGYIVGTVMGEPLSPKVSDAIHALAK